MEIGVFVDRKLRPDEAELPASLTGAFPLWKQLIDFIEGSYRTKRDWKFYGSNYGWALAFKTSRKALASLYPGSCAFTAQVIMKDEQLARVPESLMISDLQAAIEYAKPYSEGRWIFLPVKSERDLEVAKCLVEIKAR